MGTGRFPADPPPAASAPRWVSGRLRAGLPSRGKKEGPERCRRGVWPSPFPFARPGTARIPRTHPLSSSPAPCRPPPAVTPAPVPGPRRGCRGAAQAAEATPRSAKGTVPRAALRPQLGKSGGTRGSASRQGLGAVGKKHTYRAEGPSTQIPKGFHGAPTNSHSRWMY